MSMRWNLTSSFVAPSVLALGLLAVVAWSAPAPKSSDPGKIPEAGVAAEPVEVDAERLSAASMENLKRLAIACHNYASDHNDKLPVNVTDKDGKVLLSWRVHLLPYLEQQELHKQFKMDQPWDSDVNIKLLAKMPAVFASPRVRVKLAGHTVYQGFAGKGALFEPGKQWGLAVFPDGTSNTILAVESSIAVAWTRPVDLPFDEKKNVPDIGKAYGAKPLTVLCDGSVRTLNLTKMSAVTLKALITVAGGEGLGADW